jgi:hypothetical protein
MTTDDSMTSAIRTAGNQVSTIITKLLGASGAAEPSSRAKVLVALEAVETKLAKLLRKVRPSDDANTGSPN